MTEAFSLTPEPDRLIHSNWHKDQHIFHSYSVNLSFTCLNILKAILSSQNVSISRCWNHGLLPPLIAGIHTMWFIARPWKSNSFADAKGPTTLNRNAHWVVPQSLACVPKSKLSCVSKCVYFSTHQLMPSLFRGGWMYECQW